MKQIQGALKNIAATLREKIGTTDASANEFKGVIGSIEEIATAISGKSAYSECDTALGALEKINVAIENSEAIGAGGIKEKNVKLYDYDGTLVSEYTPSEFDRLAELPTAPWHADIGLESKGWNWELADAKEYVSRYGALVIGAWYEPTDGNTHLHITIDADSPVRTIPLYWNQTGTTVVDWGDGTTPDTYTSTGTQVHEHTYSDAGIYDISISASSGTLALGSNSASNNIFGASYYSVAPVLRSVNIGSGVTGISSGTFLNCSNLETVTLLPSSAINSYSFKGCFSLKALIIPAEYESSIGQEAIQGCCSCEVLSFSIGVESIGNSFASECISLAIVTIPPAITTISQMAFNLCYSIRVLAIPDSVTSIEAKAFSSLYELERLQLPVDLETIGNMAFNNLYSIKEISLPENITTIGDQVFQNCYALGSVEIVCSPSSVGKDLFNGAHIRSALVPSGWTTVPEGMFAGCKQLSSVELPDTITSIGDRAFNTCYALESIDIPSSVTSIGESAFSGCKNLQAVELPEGITSISSSAFDGCNSLVNVSIPDGVTSIGEGAFQNCWSIIALTVPATVASIGPSAFNYCYGMLEYHFLSTTPPTLTNTNTFANGNANRKIYVPSDSVSAYTSAQYWTSYQSIIVGE